MQANEQNLLGQKTHRGARLSPSATSDDTRSAMAGNAVSRLVAEIRSIGIAYGAAMAFFFGQVLSSCPRAHHPACLSSTYIVMLGFGGAERFGDGSPVLSFMDPSDPICRTGLR
jgi:hypothetical protein